VAVSFIGGGKQMTRRKLQICRKSLTKDLDADQQIPYNWGFFAGGKYRDFLPNLWNFF
jgi:hypothetical protein